MRTSPSPVAPRKQAARDFCRSIKTGAGQARRLDLSQLDFGTPVIPAFAVRRNIAARWTAAGIQAESAFSLPASEIFDTCSLPMEIVV